MFTDYKGRVCALECKDGGDHEPIHQFVGPVKLILIEPSRIDYWYKKCCPALITLSYGLLIVLISSIIIWTVTFKFPMETNVHIFLCSMGFHLLLPTGIFMLDPLFGPGTHLDTKRKHAEHAILQIFGTLFIIAGDMHLFLFVELDESLHGQIGLAASWLVLIADFVGVLAYYPKCSSALGFKHICLSIIHKTLALMILILSLATLYTGVTKNIFWIWCFFARLLELPYILISLCVIYTLCIILSVAFRCFYVHK